ncbi:neuroligin-4, X-linked-like [Panonychus citri]|uniref:neuroligin-4, X-linked-like n=1 Tax=Panonychus citri TaxID=50023 RepID=UPI002307DC43|nr:neuroligin-4, X-linked-like [Panonychus citri]XP_053211101.1 neuroligin-4, X-linked-like [Panonychus citri]XP_053211102.1 neuroligin-4, X-linked-like [Panonychus citri]XP_053211103.1 neuroligin-4, X-linked-like [Panonychus citri]
MLSLLCYIYPLLICGYEPPEVSIGWSRIMGMSQKVINNENGKEGKINIFLGVPYAEPPLNGYRFRPPEPIKSVNYFGYYAGKFKPRCISPDYYDKFLGSTYDDQQEDCLYLNIWSPANLTDPKDLKPVLVYIHDSSVDVRTIDGKTLSHLGDMVVITFDYRTGLFGLIEGYDDQISDNAIFHDTKAVLKWIQDNVSRLGGDPSRVTLFADGWESLRAGLQFSYAINEKLFAQMILRNGNSFSTSVELNPSIHWQDVLEVAEKVGCDQKKNQLLLLYCLRNSDAKDLINGYLSINGSGHSLDLHHPWVNSPEVITKSFTLDGFISESWSKMPPVLMIQMISADDVRKIALDRNHLEQIEQMVKSLELKEIKHKSCHSGPMGSKELTSWTARHLLECPFINLGQEIAQTGPVYSLLIDYGPSSEIPEDAFLFKKASSSYLEVLFGIPLTNQKYYSDDANQLSREVVKVLTEFVAQGKVKWPQLVNKETKSDENVSISASSSSSSPTTNPAYHQYWMTSDVCPQLTDLSLKVKLCQLASNQW